MISALESDEIEKGAEEFENAVAQTGFGRYNISLIFICGLCIMTVLVETLGVAYILPAAQCDLNLTMSDKGIISSISFFGVVLSSLLWGFIADAVGRKKVVLVAVCLSCICGVASSLVSQAWLFIVFRFFNGFFIGCPAAVSIPYAGEFQSNKYRSKVISWIGSFVGFSSFYLPSVAWIILPMEWSFPVPGLDITMRPWRLLVVMYSMPSILVVLCFISFPESPKYLWSIGKSEESLDVLRDMYHVNMKKSKTLFPVSKFELNIKPDKMNNLDTSPKSMGSLMMKLIKQIWNQIVPLFTMPLLPNMLITSALQFGIQTGAQGVFMWVPEIFNKLALYMGAFPSDAVTICEAIDYRNNSIILNSFTDNKETILDCADVVDEDVFKVTLILGAMSTVMCISLGFLINTVGTKLLLVIMFTSTAISGIILNYMNSYDLIVTFLCIYLMAGVCINIVMTIQVELFPTEHRAKAIGVSQMMGRLGAMTGSFITGFLLSVYCPLVFFLCAGIFTVMILLSLLLPVPMFVSRKNNGATI